MRNEMMYRPIINEDILHYLRTEQKQLTGSLGELEELAHENGVPVIPHETVVFLQFLLKQKQPKNVLESHSIRRRCGRFTQQSRRSLRFYFHG